MDYIVRATTADHQIRAFAASTTELVEQAREYHNTSPVATAALGRLLTAGAMMGVMMKGEGDLLTLQILCNGPIGGLTVTADADAHVKGYVNNPMVMLPATAEGKLDVGAALGDGDLNVIKDLGMKDPYIGQCKLQSGEIGDDLTYYFAVSEQIPSSVGLGVLMERDNTVRQAGGFTLQLLPETPDDVIRKLEEKLSGLDSVTAMLDAGMTPEDILLEILGDFGVMINEKIPAEYRCNCSRKRMLRALMSVGKSDLQEMIDEGKPVELCCQFCNKKYEITIDELKKLSGLS